MKKFYFYSCLGIICLIVALILVGCGNSNFNLLDNLSDARYGVFDGKNDDFNATFIYGERENPYAPDGIRNKTVDFGIISVVFKEKPTASTPIFTLKTETKTYSGELEKSPFTDEYMADIGEQITNDNILELTIDGYEVLNLDRKNNTFEIDFEKALTIGENGLKNEIKELAKNGKVECYLKIIYNNKSNYGTYFWAFSIIGEDGTKHNVIFSTNSGEILVKN